VHGSLKILVVQGWNAYQCNKGLQGACWQEALPCHTMSRWECAFPHFERLTTHFHLVPRLRMLQLKPGVLNLFMAWGHIQPFLLTHRLQGYESRQFIETSWQFFRMLLTLRFTHYSIILFNKSVTSEILDTAFAYLIRQYQVEFLLLQFAFITPIVHK
jgi:hypothetical protein